MQQYFDKQLLTTVKSAPTAFLTKVIIMTTVVYAVSAGLVQAQSGQLGTYSGTINVSGTEFNPEVSYRASIKLSLPVTERNDDSITAEFLSGEAPNAIVSVSELSMSYTEKSADSGGQFNSWKCTLAAPAEIEMSPSGVLNVDLEAKTHALSISFVALADVPMNCEHSRSGPYKENKGIPLYIGTGVPGYHYETQLPFTDAARLTADYTLIMTGDAAEQYGPIIQQWDLALE